MSALIQLQSIAFVTDLITSIFLFAQWRINTSRANLAPAIGYLYTALLVIPYTLAYPCVFTGLLNAGPQSSVWLYYFWIDGIPLGAIAYALFIIADRNASPNQARDSYTVMPLSMYGKHYEAPLGVVNPNIPTYRGAFTAGERV